MTSVHTNPAAQGPNTPPDGNADRRTTRPAHGVVSRFAQQCSWNRAHWIGVIALAVLLLLISYSRLATFLPELDGRPIPDGFVWTPVMTAGYWPVGLGVANLVLGSIRSGSLSFPLVSALMGPLGFGWAHLRMLGYVEYYRWDDWLELMREHGGELAVQALGGCAVLLLAYAAVAFCCFAIGRYGLRRLFIAPSETSASGRMVTWARRDAVRFGCWLTLAITYGLVIAFSLIRGQLAMAAALMINFVVPPVLLVTCGAYASRDAAMPGGCRVAGPGTNAGEAGPDGGRQRVVPDWLRSLLFPAACTLIGAVAVFVLAAPYQDECPINGVCTPIGNGWFIDWTTLVDTVPSFLVLYLVAGYLGYGVVLIVRFIARAIRSRL
ncbi:MULTISPECIES: hypothetical protein [Bifidobacterium]|uniref:hypothetical protein n=1 Tax=Bifidobacterium TaxID=1678 RepID=UPI001BDBCEF7|nr:MULTISPECIES: hypothetical protein [Bifidobacterium]MBT1161100.1 hypothetical protein [Bifidobacterium sp. SO1]MBW3078174.1 hypothetical protein [Bifidobacterium simiiventris]